jgi:hypothetical protein
MDHAFKADRRLRQQRLRCCTEHGKRAFLLDGNRLDEKIAGAAERHAAVRDPDERAAALKNDFLRGGDLQLGIDAGGVDILVRREGTSASIQRTAALPTVTGFGKSPREILA